MISVNTIDVETINDDFLFKLTKANAAIIKAMNLHWNDLDCWLQGEKATGAWIVFKYAAQCDDGHRCTYPSLPNCCDDYLDLIDIVDVKERQAYFIWIEKGRHENNSVEVMKQEYMEACVRIFSFCKHVMKRKCQTKNCKCPYNEILIRVDRRKADRRKADRRQPKKSDRRLAKVIQLPLNIIYERRKGERRNGSDHRVSERRIKDHRGPIAMYL